MKQTLCDAKDNGTQIILLVSILYEHCLIKLSAVIEMFYNFGLSNMVATNYISFEHCA